MLAWRGIELFHQLRGTTTDISEASDNFEIFHNLMWTVFLQTTSAKLADAYKYEAAARAGASLEGVTVGGDRSR